MGLFRTPEARRRAAQQEAADRSAADAAFARSPLGRARAAAGRGDRVSQIDLEVSALTGVDSFRRAAPTV